MMAERVESGGMGSGAYGSLLTSESPSLGESRQGGTRKRGQIFSQNVLWLKFMECRMHKEEHRQNTHSPESTNG